MYFIRTLSLVLAATICTTTAAAPLSRRDILATIARRVPDPQNDSAECTEATLKLNIIFSALRGEEYPEADEARALALAETWAAIADESKWDAAGA
ncbi:hypothetical protein N7532_002994 [Penicillium argentinense]|uniref:Uncharacterized protein n=1 Tax=Penicillium argentinense TaxID=1131581 RepID=A0A9W9KDH5_9EURO|nr:uncharacterized protein N7532_002994 [Penicillium argentinense]KAJ5102465.1 hypothetical protein N7532_002994 [Penicillium argentinense]